MEILFWTTAQMKNDQSECGLRQQYANEAIGRRERCAVCHEKGTKDRK